MNAREAILKAASHIESNPNSFDFSKVNFPHTCGSPGCALGWIGFFAELPDMHSRWRTASWDVLRASREVLGLNDTTHSNCEFYDRMDQLACDGWTRNASRCATGLRLYADKYDPAESRALIPASVMRIFTMTPEELSREMSSV